VFGDGEVEFFLQKTDEGSYDVDEGLCEEIKKKHDHHQSESNGKEDDDSCKELFFHGVLPKG
jgi:hypothetical protein